MGSLGLRELDIMNSDVFPVHRAIGLFSSIRVNIEVKSSQGVYSSVCSTAGKRSLTMAPSSSPSSSQRPQGKRSFWPSDMASISTQSRNQPDELPVTEQHQGAAGTILLQKPDKTMAGYLS